MKTNLIEITVSGMTSSGKTAIGKCIEEAMQDLNLAVTYSDPALRHNQYESYREIPESEKPKKARGSQSD